jgi:hypothetical protein
VMQGSFFLFSFFFFLCCRGLRHRCECDQIGRGL